MRFMVCSRVVHYSIVSGHRSWKLHHGVLPDEVVSGHVSVLLWVSVLRHDTRVASVTSVSGPAGLETRSSLNKVVSGMSGCFARTC